MYRIFVVEDDPVIARVVKQRLEDWGCAVHCAENFREVTREFSACAPQLVLLDITLPFYNGYHWCAEIRRQSSVPIVFLSSASDKMNMVMAMNMGADDFIAKPFDLDVLVAKVQAILRRTYDFTRPAGALYCGGAELDPAAGVMRNGAFTVELTKNEARILQLLMEQKGRIVTREALMTRLWQSDSFVDENTLTVNVGRLRKKLEEAGLAGMIRTKKGEGYLLEEVGADAGR